MSCPHPGPEFCVVLLLTGCLLSPSHLTHTLLLLLCLLLSTVEKLLALKDQDWSDFLQQLCSHVDSSEKSTGAMRAKLNLLCYLCVVATHKEVATRLLHSPLVGTARWMSIPGTPPLWQPLHFKDT